MRYFADRLELLGFLKYAQPAAIVFIKQGFRERGWAGIYGDTGRLFPADAESLFEGGIGSFLHQIAPFLAGQGVQLEQVTEHYAEDGYWLIVNGCRHEIWTAKDQRSNWSLSTVRTFELVNGLLESAGSRERMYAVNDGNDLFGFFLTPELKAIISGHPDYRIPDGPYLPTDMYAHLGRS